MACGCGGSAKKRPSAMDNPGTYWNGPRKTREAANASAAPKPDAKK
jgi:hypothetical protein